MINTKGKEGVNFYSKGKEVLRIYSRDKIAWEPFDHIPASILFGATAGENTLHLRPQINDFDCTVLWGDGQQTVIPTDGGNVTHNYAVAGDYNIKITGRSFPGFFVKNQPGKEKYKALYSMGKWERDVAVDFFAAFYGCTSLTAIPADLFRHNAAATTFHSAFLDCPSLATIPANLFKYNAAATNFSYAFNNCPSLTAIPTDLFRYNAAVRTFSAVFANCPNLKALPPDLFRYNEAATDYSYIFAYSPSLTMRADMFGADYPNRFARAPNANFTECFNRGSFTGTIGTAPALWSFAFPSQPQKTSCFAGPGNSPASLTNYTSIPADWK